MNHNILVYLTNTGKCILMNLIPLETDISTDFGQVRLIWVDTASGPKVRKIFLPGDRRPDTPGVTQATPDEVQVIHHLAAGIQAFLRGTDVAFDTGILDLDLCTRFQRSVLLAEYGIPRGYVSTYGRIARYIGIPSGARAVGNALARNPFPIVIPCHRALRSDGSLGGFQGGREMKERLLRMEGVRIGENGRVVMEQVWYEVPGYKRTKF